MFVDVCTQYRGNLAVMRAKHYSLPMWCVWLHYEVAIPQILATEIVYTEITVKRLLKCNSVRLMPMFLSFFTCCAKHMPSRPGRKVNFIL